MNAGRRRRPRLAFLVALIAALIVPALWANPEEAREKLLDLLDTPPSGSGVLVVYSKTRSSLWTTSGARMQPIHNDELPPIELEVLLGGANPDLHVFHAPEGDYLLPPYLREYGVAPIRARLEAGELTALRFEPEGHQATELTRAQLLSDPLLGELDVKFRDLGRYAHRRAAVQMLNGEDIVVRSEGDCLVEPVRVLWPNAQLTAEVADCRMQRARLRYKQGISVEMPLLPVKMLGISWMRHGHEGQPTVRQVFTGSPADLAGIGPATLVVAVDGQPVPRDDQSYKQASRMIARAAGAVTLTIVAPADGAAPREITVEPALFPATRLVFRAGEPMEYRFPNGRRFDGPIAFEPAPEQGRPLPLPRLGQLGQLTGSGNGYIGQFADARPHGRGYCFAGDGRNGEPCRYERGVRVDADTGVPSRSRKAILAETQGLSGRAAIDLLKRKMVDALSAERWSRFLRHHSDLQTLGVDTGLEAIYYEARALAALDRVAAAFDRVQTYLNLAGSSGTAYADALALYAELEPRAAADRAAREREREQARTGRRAFCEARIEMAAPLCGCREFEGLVPEEMECRT